MGRGWIWNSFSLRCATQLVLQKLAPHRQPPFSFPGHLYTPSSLSHLYTPSLLSHFPMPSILSRLSSSRSPYLRRWYTKRNDDFEIDWVAEGAVTSVKEQTAEDCWALVPMDAIASLIKIRFKIWVKPSVKEITDKVFWNPKVGGRPELAYQYASLVGVATEKDYEIFQRKRGAIFIHSYGIVEKGNEMAILNALKKQPLAAAILASESFFNYKGGLFENKYDPKEFHAWHMILIVGVGHERGKRYLLTKNSYDTTWGDKGFAKILCDGTYEGIMSINLNVTYPIIGNDINPDDFRDYLSYYCYTRSGIFDNWAVKYFISPCPSPKGLIYIPPRFQELNSFEEGQRIPPASDVTMFMIEFEEYFLELELLKALYEQGFRRPSPVQEATIPKSTCSDIVAIANDGTGKTTSICIMMLNNIDVLKNVIQAVILVPTKEMALQTSQLCKILGKQLNIEVMVAKEGTSLKDDIECLNGSIHLLVATPKRIIVLAKKGVPILNYCSMLVLDEADKLLSPKLQPSVEQIIGLMPTTCQIFIFSATLSGRMKDFKDKYLRRPYFINLRDKPTTKGMTQYYVMAEEKHRPHWIELLLLQIPRNQCIIFCNSVERVEMLGKRKTKAKLAYSCCYAHSQMPQDHLDKVLSAFRSGECKVLVCDDLPTRIVETQAVDLVVNYDIPKNSRTYLHRVGRLKGLAQPGIVVNMLHNSDDYFSLLRMVRELGNSKMDNITQQYDRNNKSWSLVRD